MNAQKLQYWVGFGLTVLGFPLIIGMPIVGLMFWTTGLVMMITTEPKEVMGG